MARILIVGCGCRGGELATALIAGGHLARGTTRDPRRVPEIEAAGAEALVADPDRLATLQRAIDGASVACWLMGSAAGDPKGVAALHGERLASMLELVVDTPVRGFVYEAGGTVDAALLRSGCEIAHRAARTYEMPVEIVSAPPAPRGPWLAAMQSAVAKALS
ncbi:MAG: hypothetical protein NVSMB25_17760 [Thermoleophilaceae bacterium]